MKHQVIDVVQQREATLLTAIEQEFCFWRGLCAPDPHQISVRNFPEHPRHFGDLHHGSVEGGRTQRVCEMDNAIAVTGGVRLARNKNNTRASVWPSTRLGPLFA